MDNLKKAEITMKLDETENSYFTKCFKQSKATSHINFLQDADDVLAEKIKKNLLKKQKFKF